MSLAGAVLDRRHRDGLDVADTLDSAVGLVVGVHGSSRRHDGGTRSAMGVLVVGAGVGLVAVGAGHHGRRLVTRRRRLDRTVPVGASFGCGSSGSLIPKAEPQSPAKGSLSTIKVL